MKKMTFLGAVLSLLIFSACGNDDDNSSNTDAIVGSWQLESYMSNDVTLELTECEAQSTAQFMANGSFTSSFFEEDFDTSECIETETVGTWENLGDNIYSLSEPGDVEPSEVHIEFSENNNTLSIIDEDGTDVFKTIMVRM